MGGICVLPRRHRQLRSPSDSAHNFQYFPVLCGVCVWLSADWYTVFSRVSVATFCGVAFCHFYEETHYDPCLSHGVLFSCHLFASGAGVCPLLYPPNLPHPLLDTRDSYPFFDPCL